MTSPIGFSPDDSVSYSARICARCATPMTRTLSRFKRTVWRCTGCGKHER